MKKLWVSFITHYLAKGQFPVNTRIPCTGWSVGADSTAWYHHLYFIGSPKNCYDPDSLLGSDSKTYVLHFFNTEFLLQKIRAHSAQRLWLHNQNHPCSISLPTDMFLYWCATHYCLVKFYRTSRTSQDVHQSISYCRSTFAFFHFCEWHKVVFHGSLHLLGMSYN